MALKIYQSLDLKDNPIVSDSFIDLKLGSNVILRAAAGGVGIFNVTNPSARLHLPPGSASPGTAPLKLIGSPLMTTPEAGAVEYDGTAIYFTTSSGTRQKFALLPVDLSTSDVTGVLPVSKGGTGLNSLGTAGQLLKVNSGGTGLEYFTPSYLTNSGLSDKYIPMFNSATGQLQNSGFYERENNKFVYGSTGAVDNGISWNIRHDGVSGNPWLGVSDVTKKTLLLGVYSTNARPFIQSYDYNAASYTNLIINPLGGNVSINTNSNAEALNVNGSLFLVNSGSSIMYIQGGEVNGTNRRHAINMLMGGFGTSDNGITISVGHRIDGTASSPVYNSIHSAIWQLGLETQNKAVTIYRKSGGGTQTGGTSFTREDIFKFDTDKLQGLFPAGTGNLPSFSFYSDTNTGLFSPSSDALAITTAGTERMRVDASGNVGIATTNPVEKLDITGNLKLSGVIKNADGSASSPSYSFSSATNYGMFLFSAGSALGWSTAGTARMYLDSTKLDIIPSKLTLGGLQAIYLPFGSPGGTILYGNGGSSISHTSGVQGYYNTSLGISALSAITTGAYNTSLGYNSLNALTTGQSNTCVGSSSCSLLTTGQSNTVVGYGALTNITTTGYNTVVGSSAASAATSMSGTVAVGYEAGRYYWNGTSYTSLLTANDCVYIGTTAAANADGVLNEIAIGKDVIGNGSNTVTIGNNNITKTFLKGKLSIGVTDPLESIHTNGAIILGDATGTTDGTIRWTGTDFEGRKGGSWVSLTAGAGAVTGSGTTNFMPYWSSPTSLSSSPLEYDSAGNTGVKCWNQFAAVVSNSSTSQFVGDAALWMCNFSGGTNSWITAYFAENLGTNVYGALQMKKVDSTNKYGEYHFVTNSTDGLKTRMKITHQGYVGIGYDSPGVPLHVGGQTNVEGVITSRGSGNTPKSTATTSEYRLFNTTTLATFSLFYDDSKVFKMVVDTSNNEAYTITDDLVHTVKIKQASTSAYKIASGTTDLMVANTTSGSEAIECKKGFKTEGYVVKKVTTVSANTTVDNSHHVIIANATTANITVTLPSAPLSGREITVIKEDNSSNTVTISGNGNNINGSASYVLSSQFAKATIVYSGSAWYVIAN